MALQVVNVGRIDSNTIMVEFSDASFSMFTVRELVGLKRYLATPDVMGSTLKPN